MIARFVLGATLVLLLASGCSPTKTVFVVLREVPDSPSFVVMPANDNLFQDRVRFSFGVRGLGSTLEEAIKQATERVVRIATKLKQVGIEERQIRTSYFNSADNPEGKSWWSSSRDFAAAYEMTITIDSVFDLVEPAISALAAEPVEHVSRLEFSLRNDAAKRLEVSNAAALDARRKAEQLASSLGVTISDVLYVEDQSQGPITPPGFPNVSLSSVMALQAGIKSLYPPSQIPVEGKVKVVFELARRE
jgi:uncharacterized protein YggE